MPLPLLKTSNPGFGQMPDSYSEAEATTYEVIFGVAFEAESHWQVGEAPPPGSRRPAFPEAHKGQVPPPRAATGHLQLLTGLKAGEAHRAGRSCVGGGGGLRDPGSCGMGLVCRSGHGHFPNRRRRL